MKRIVLNNPPQTQNNYLVNSCLKMENIHKNVQIATETLIHGELIVLAVIFPDYTFSRAKTST